MLFLAIAGLVLGLAGTGLSMWGQAEENRTEQQRLRENLPLYESEQKTIRAQQGEVDKDILAAGGIYSLNQKALSIQGQQVAYAGAEAKGQVGARSGAGNLAGASILRQALSVQRKTEQQMSLLAGEKQKLGIEYSDTLREFDIKKMSLATSLLTSETKERQDTEEADWLKKYGWMSVAGVGLSGLGSALGNWNYTPKAKA
jgi:hypothetical protein